MIRSKYFSLLLASAFSILPGGTLAAAKTPGANGSSAEVRSAVEHAFQQLRAGEYSALYDALPAASQKRITRERFTHALEQTRDMYQLERLDFGTVNISGDLAVVETTIYGRVRRPIEGEGKIAAQQYLVREGGRWRITAIDRTTQKQLLSAHPEFARRFPLHEPRIYFKRDGQWVSMGSLSTLRQQIKK